MFGFAYIPKNFPDDAPERDKHKIFDWEEKERGFECSSYPIPSIPGRPVVTEIRHCFVAAPWCVYEYLLLRSNSLTAVTMQVLL